jgi:methylisocitrate lyase
VGIEHMVPQELMVAKVREAVAARREDLFIIARTNGVRASSMDDALRRVEAYREAGADALLLLPRNQEEARHIGERLAPPLMLLTGGGGLAGLDMTPAELHGLGFRILVDAMTPLLAAFEAMRAVYQETAGDFTLRSRPVADWKVATDALHEVIGLARLIAIEKDTVEQ